MATWRPISLTLAEEREPLPPQADPPRSHRRLRLLERLLLIIGIVCLGYYGYVSAETALYQAYETRELDAILASAPTSRPDTRRYNPTSEPASPKQQKAPVAKAGTILGRLEIPRLRVSAIVRAGSDSRTLRLAVGHIGGTALPGEQGNLGLAAHRDTFFRKLGKIRPNDRVRLVTPEGTFDYRVAGTQIVEPHETWVLNPTEEPALTLVTCYPFRYIGSAPQRFIVRAHLAGR